MPQTGISLTNFFGPHPTYARTDGGEMRRAGRDLRGRSSTLSWMPLAQSELVFVLVPGALSKVRSFGVTCTLSMLILYGCADMKMSDPRPTFAYLATTLRDKHPKLAYLHVVESPVVGDSDIDQDKENNDFLREIWNGGKDGEGKIFISTGGYNQEAALHTAKEKGGLIGFGRSYISNVRAPPFQFQSLYSQTY